MQDVIIMEKFALTFPGITGQITPPPNVPSGGLFPSGAIGENIIRTGITVFLMIIVITALLYTVSYTHLTLPTTPYV